MIDNKIILENISLTVDKGDILAIVGSNGCGKTTLLTCVMNIIRPEKGSIEYMDVKHDTKTVLKDFYYIQDYIFFPKGRSIAEIVDYEKCFFDNFDEEKVFELTDEFGFNINDIPSSMSKGQKKIIAFILCLASNASVLILDELIDGLDIVMKRRIWSYVIDVTMEREATVLISSHDIRELENICNKYLLMHDGRIIKNNDLELEKEGMKRIQFSVDKKFEQLASDDFEIISFSQYGSVVNAIVQGDYDKFQNKMNEMYQIGLYEQFEVSLEDIMLYNLKEEGYSYE
jgi:ABC-2 type transport system ATP-binding protein